MYAWVYQVSLALRFSHQNPVCTSSLRHTSYRLHPSHFSWFDHPINIWWGVQVSLCSLLHSPVTSSLPGPNIFLSTLFSNILSLRSFVSVRDQVSQPHRSTGKISSAAFCKSSSKARKSQRCPLNGLISFDRSLGFFGFSICPSVDR